jgi:hypothetical protein
MISSFSSFSRGKGRTVFNQSASLANIGSTDGCSAYARVRLLKLLRLRNFYTTAAVEND